MWGANDNSDGIFIKIVILFILIFVLGFRLGSCDYINNTVREENIESNSNIYDVCCRLGIQDLYIKSTNYEDNINFDVIRDMEMYNKDTGDTLLGITGNFYVIECNDYCIIVVRYGEKDFKYYYISGYNIGKNIRYIGKSADLGYNMSVTENKFTGGE